MIFLNRSAPASPNHIGISGLSTPDSLSREGSPTQDNSRSVDGSESQVTMPAPHLSLPTLAQKMAPGVIPTDIRFSQSAPGSPSGENFTMDGSCSFCIQC